MSAALRMRGLIRKEIKQVLRDPSAILIAFLLPIVLMLVNGFGISFDARHMRLAVVAESADEQVRELIEALGASPYLAPDLKLDMAAAQAGLARGELRVSLVGEDFGWRLRQRSAVPAPLSPDVNGTDLNSARLLEGYVSGAVETWIGGEVRERRLAPTGPAPTGLADCRDRPAAPLLVQSGLRSADAIIPGLHRHGDDHERTLLTALIVSRELERGTMESMLASPARMAELIASKLICYFVLGLGSMALATVIALVLFDLPLRGGMAALAPAAALFMGFALGLGLFISTLARNQFVALQAAFPSTMLPAMMPSGMLFDIASMPRWLQWITFAVPARYLVSILQTVFLAGDVWSVAPPNPGWAGGGGRPRDRRHADGHAAAAGLKGCDGMTCGCGGDTGANTGWQAAGFPLRVRLSFPV